MRNAKWINENRDVFFSFGAGIESWLCMYTTTELHPSPRGLLEKKFHKTS
jgi:hypothetical protein